MAPSLSILNVKYDIYPMDVSDLSSAGESTSRSRHNSNKAGDSRRRIPRKERAKTRRDRRQNGGRTDLLADSSHDSREEAEDRGADLRLRRSVTADAPLMMRRRQRNRSPTNVSTTSAVAPHPLRRVSTESGIDLNTAPLLPRRRRSLHEAVSCQCGKRNSLASTVKTASITEYCDESARLDESATLYQHAVRVSVRSPTTSEEPIKIVLRRKPTMDSLPSKPSSSRRRDAAATTSSSSGYRRNQSMDSIPVRPLRSLAVAKTRMARPRSQPTLMEEDSDTSTDRATAGTFRRHQSMDSLPSKPLRRASLVSRSSPSRRPQKNAVWH